MFMVVVFFFFQAEDGIRDDLVTGVQTCALPIWGRSGGAAGAAVSCRRPGCRRGNRTGSRRDRVPPPCRTAGKIGRASCRERVEISVVAVSLKKKKRKRGGQ